MRPLLAVLLILLFVVCAFGAEMVPGPIPTKPDWCTIIGEPQDRVVTLPDGLGTAVVTMVPVELKSKKMGFSWMDGDGLVVSSASIKSITEKRRKERDERAKSAGQQD